MDSNESVFNLPSEPFEPLGNYELIEPEVWIEFSSDKVVMFPAGITVRHRRDGRKNAWEYLC